MAIRSFEKEFQASRLTKVELWVVDKISRAGKVC